MDIMMMTMMTEDIKNKNKNKAKILTSSYGGHMYYDWS